MLVFVLGGVTGLINASYSVNQVIHNTTWVPGHFHMTVGTAVALTFIGVAYWLIPCARRAVSCGAGGSRSRSRGSTSSAS